MTNQTRLQYYCSSCRNVLREAESDMHLPTMAEPCPYCGAWLPESLEKKRLVPRQEISATFQRASAVPRLAIDVRKMDEILPFLSIGQKVLVTGRHSQKIIERLAVRAQMPPRHVGLGSHVVMVDGGNSSDPYLCTDFARQYGLDVNVVLSRIISSRAFTVYQLASLVTRELPDVVKRYGAKLVVISDMLSMFCDPYLDTAEAENLAKYMASSISGLRECLVVSSISKPTRYDNIIAESFDRVIRLDESDHFISVGMGEGKIQIREDDLEVVPRR
ncbi:MAG TPA: hypothetical protein VJ792_03905 [Candidatus Nitrosotalea sp.]|nr:hypothetical protein [Candidatus Nitrosotalea sp.]